MRSLDRLYEGEHKAVAAFPFPVKPARLCFWFGVNGEVITLRAFSIARHILANVLRTVF
jgi:hypothetical protein